MAEVGVWPALGIVWSPWGRGRSPGPCMAALREWPVPWTMYRRRGLLAGPLGLYGHHGSVACRLGAKAPPGGVAGSLGHVWTAWVRGRSPRPRMAAVEALPVIWAPYGRW